MAAPTYLNAINNFLTPKQNSRSSDQPKINYWRPGLGTYKVRILKLKTDDNLPILGMLHYNKPLVPKRINAPVGWGMPDPINEQFETLRKTKDGWEIAKHLKPQRCFYAAVLVRGEEDKGAQIWEIKEDFVKAVYNLCLSDENKNEDILDYNLGYDFEIKIVPAMKDGKPKLWEGKPCKSVNAPVQSRSPSPLSKNKETQQEIIDSIPDYFENQKRWCKSPEDLIQILEEFLENLQETTPVLATSTDKVIGAKRSKATTTESDQVSEDVDPATDAALDDAFGAF